MKKSLSLIALVIALPFSSTFAADLPSHKEAVAAPVIVPMWTGFYAGLNAGYNWGTNTNAYSQNWGIHNGIPAAEVPAFMSVSPISMDGVISNTQSGFMGGAQFGYNYQYGANIVIGVETDIQGSNTYGKGRSAGATAGSIVDAQEGLFGNYSAIGATRVKAGLNYLGTVRGRIGYLFTPALLVYGTGGFAYGGAWAEVDQTASVNTNNPNEPEFVQGGIWNGNGEQNQLLTGWTAGAGLEWMFMPNWSLKGEALYWDLGRMNINTASYNSWGDGIGWGRTNVNYAGVVARAGVNYHFNFASAPVVAKF